MGGTVRPQQFKQQQYLLQRTQTSEKRRAELGRVRTFSAKGRCAAKCIVAANLGPMFTTAQTAATLVSYKDTLAELGRALRAERMNHRT